MHNSNRFNSHRAARRGTILPAVLTAFALTGLAVPNARAVMNVGVAVDGTTLGKSNFSDRSNVVVSYEYYQEYPVPNALPPLWATMRGFGESNGEAGTLKAQVAIQNPGPGYGIYPNHERTVVAYMEENIRLFSTNGTGNRNVGLAGLGDPNDDFITIRAKGTLRGSASVGTPTGLPPGTSTFAGGVAGAVFSLALGVNGSPKTSFTITESTNIVETTITRNDNPFSANLGNAHILGDAIYFNISKTFLANNLNTTVYFRASLRANARVGSFSGAQANANYHNSAYLDFDVEEGSFWLPDGTSATRKFLTAQVFPPAPVPEPGTSALLMAGLGMLVHAARRRRAQAGCVSGGPDGVAAVG